MTVAVIMQYQLFALSILTLLPRAGHATPLASPWDEVSVKHAWKTVPDNWEPLGPPHSNTTINLHIALKPENENALTNALYEVSTPGHPKYDTLLCTIVYLLICTPTLLHRRYGAHLSKEGVAELVAPHPNTLELVHSWLAHHGVQSSSISTTLGGSWLTLIDVPVFQANNILGASYQLYRRAKTNDTAILRTIRYSLPTVLHAHVQTIAPATFFASERTLQQTPHIRPVGAARAPAKAALREELPNPGFDPEVGVTPDLLIWLYKTYAYTPKAIAKNKLGVTGFSDELPGFSDLQLFMIALRSDAVDATFDIQTTKGSDVELIMPGVEPNQNMQYTQAIAYPTPHIFYSNGDRMVWSFTGDLYLTWIAYMLQLEDKDIPQTITVSFGTDENDVPPEYAKPVCDTFAMLGARGVSLLFASGNSGVGTGDCKDKSGKVQFIPTFPASCMCDVIPLPTSSAHSQALSR